MLKSWLIALRLPTLALATLPVISALYLAKLTGSPSVTLLINILASACLIQIISNLANDYFDFASGDDQNLKDRKKILLAGGISLQQLKLVLICLTIVCIGISTPLVIIGGLPILIIGLSGLCLAFLYSYSKLSLAKNFLAELTAFLYFGPIASWGSYYLLSQSISSINAILIGLPAGLISLNLLTINNWRDYQADKLSNRKNLVQCFGLNKIQIPYLLLTILTTIAYFILLNDPTNILIGSICLIFNSVQFCFITRTQVNFQKLFISLISQAVLIQISLIINY